MSRRTPRRLELAVESLTPDGLGRGRFAERSVAARNALPGEHVEMRVLRRRRGVWYGEADTPEARAETRRVPLCAHFPRCGGCSLQHLSDADQLELKGRCVAALLAEQGVVARRVRAPFAGPRFHYRHKARLGARLVGDELLVGFREGFSSRVARISDCKTLAEPFARALPELAAALGMLSEPGRIPQVELCAGDRAYAVIVRHLTALTAGDVERLRRFARHTGMHVYAQSGGYDTLRGIDDPGPPRLLGFGNPDFGLHLEFLPTDFTQVNPDVNRALVSRAVLGLAPRPGSSVLDLFCGIGNFALALASSGCRVHGFEKTPGAVDRAAHNARHNGLDAWAEFAVADLYDSRCPELPAADRLLLDPPRSGAGPNLERWTGSPRLTRIVYVSCNPATFAGDAARLVGQGFTLEEVGIFDMFPHTAHVETLGVFARTDSAAGG